MCHKNIFAYVYPDGHRVEQVKYDPCEHSRHGQPCKLTKTFQHPVEYVRPGQLSTPGYGFGQFPPTPPTSSHSASASDSEHSAKERKGVYIKGDQVIDLNRRSSRRDRGDRTVYVESSPLSRTPPRKYDTPRSIPSSPRDETFHVRDSRRRESPDERPRSSSSHHRPSIEIKIVNGHRRHGSNKSSSQDGEDEEQRRRRRRNSHVRFEDDEKQKKIQSAIDRANEDIANRPAIPASSSKAVRAPARYRRGSVVVDPTETSLVAAMDQLKLEREQQEREQRRRERRAAEQRKREQEEEEAQRRRLKERMAPKRHATDSQSSGRARQKVLYDDGRYYWE
ncbi:hypothetical protein GGS26DRAFT_443616 [Hypomontagnella submonticulosa]|nr:hypothetical protein GGS26DRAFT_443616 [Hypomontagnella submonticulosa]